jgi:hypothetical protein
MNPAGDGKDDRLTTSRWDAADEPLHQKECLFRPLGGHRTTGRIVAAEWEDNAEGNGTAAEK